MHAFGPFAGMNCSASLQWSKSRFVAFCKDAFPLQCISHWIFSERTTGGGSDFRVLLVVNCNLEPDCVDSELRVALQWIAASELGLPAVYFRKSKEKSLAKVDIITIKT